MSRKTSDESCNGPNYEIALLDYGDYKQAAKTLYHSFKNDLFTNYYFHHLAKIHIDQSVIERLKYDLMKQQLKYYLSHRERYLCVGIKDGLSSNLICVSIWKMPESSYLLKRRRNVFAGSSSPTANKQQSSFFSRSIKNKLLSLNVQFKIGSSGARKMNRVNNITNYTENGVLDIQNDQLFYQLFLIGTHPSYQKNGYASILINYMIDYITKDYTLLERKMGNSVVENISNCDYDNSDKSKPPIIVEASTLKNYNFYKQKFGFTPFAGIYINDADVNSMIKIFSNDEKSGKYLDDIEDINNVQYFKINTMILNRSCSDVVKVVA
ncbi:hypothetical protein DASC09_046660 [Saccharomycopsis crataegensis]|uniref:N-acetyltransferase domain-containing protein n=1 Tax=Saccharomycopsis crataegensis TaxID=43959 RepID=A0AAV5QS30_9ASCO|nr:hypothetical protein DASC09_046660 [Saccharomycopsis crataegensis]